MTHAHHVFLTYRSVSQTEERIFQNYAARIQTRWCQKSGRTRAKTFSIWRINFSEMAPKKFLFGACFFDDLYEGGIITHLQIFSQGQNVLLRDKQEGESEDSEKSDNSDYSEYSDSPDQSEQHETQFNESGRDGRQEWRSDRDVWAPHAIHQAGLA